MKSLRAFMMGAVLFSVLAHGQVFTYGPTVALSGTLELQTFPGPPNYESIRNGDKRERCFYLRLDVPVEVEAKGAHPGVVNVQTERNVSVVQLAIDAEDDRLWSRFRKAGPGQRVKVEGTLFHQFTGHHHSRVLISVSKMVLQ
jgi:hypothetical protein